MLYFFMFLPTFEQRCSMDGTTKKLTNCQTVAPSMVDPTSVSQIFFHVEIQLHRIVGTGFRIHFMYWIVGGRLFQCLLASWLTLLRGSKRWFYKHFSSFFWIHGTTQKHHNLKSNCAMYCFPAGFWHWKNIALGARASEYILCIGV